MSNILLVEPDYRSKFPPLGLMKIASFYKERNDAVTFIRGKVSSVREVNWHKIYISSLFTYELPRTVSTIKYYFSSVDNPSENLIVGGIGATLFPDYIREQVNCKIIEGRLNKEGMLEEGSPSIDNYIPDYSLIDSVSWKYKPEDSYFCRITKGCIRNCNFCAVPKLEPEFGYLSSVASQVNQINEKYGERQNLVIMDNNILAIDQFETVISEIRNLGFKAGSKRNNKLRFVDFNQGIDARLITPKIAKLLSSICLSPVRLAFDHDAIEKSYRKAIKELTDVGFKEFTNYVMFNFEDTPESFYNRIKINIELSSDLGVRITGFPMKYIPINDITRKYISKNWHWRYLRGIQCVLQATRGLVSPNPGFFEAAFGSDFKQFLEIISMPDHYIIHRNQFKNKAQKWKELFSSLNPNDKEEFLTLLHNIHFSSNRRDIILANSKYHSLLKHYYPDVIISKKKRLIDHN